ncbi:hypothetical protein AC579_9200 [Pseudocercospora musae]|uniref:Uncharacterized protein n=1 Tax=Pseudocercospora musae TaxID=113226 RepID=A0A139GTH5_9PEZI|nr:hypothetical protein AC579_9200 [Pseudocercospora musae]
MVLRNRKAAKSHRIRSFAAKAILRQRCDKIAANANTRPVTETSLGPLSLDMGIGYLNIKISQKMFEEPPNPAQKLHNRHRENVLKTLLGPESSCLVSALTVLVWAQKKTLIFYATMQTNCKPVLLKEKFADSLLHSLALYGALLGDGDGNEKVELKDIEGHSPSSRGVSIVEAHQPQFTYLHRHQLLSYLEARQRDFRGKRTTTEPADVSSGSRIDILGLKAAFSGAHVDALSATWDGI